MTVVKIPLSKGGKLLRFQAGTTKNIINEVTRAYLLNRDELKGFAESLRGATVEESARNIWHFVHDNIHYDADPPGMQWVKSPSRLWHDKSGDCKSFSVFIGCFLHALGIDVMFRFASYDPASNTPTHVYPVIPGTPEIIVDAVYHKFNEQKEYSYKIDLPRKKII